MRVRQVRWQLREIRIRAIEVAMTQMRNSVAFSNERGNEFWFYELLDNCTAN
jgi:hypothetical protein